METRTHQPQSELLGQTPYSLGKLIEWKPVNMVWDLQGIDNWNLPTR